MTGRVLLTVAAVALTACVQEADQPADVGADGTAAPTVDWAVETQAGMDRYTEAYNRGDAAAVGAIFAEDAVLLPPGEPRVSGRAAIQQWYEQNFASGAQPRFSGSVEGSGGGDEWGWDTGDIRIEATPPGGEPMVTEAKFLATLRRAADGTVLVHRLAWNTSTADTAGMAEPAAR